MGCDIYYGALRALIRTWFLSLLFMLTGIPLVATAADHTKTVYRDFRQAYQNQEWTDAIEHGMRLHQLRPDNPLTQYNLACVWALQGDPDKALSWLEKAAQSGFIDLERLESDPDFDTLHSLSGWSGVIENVRANRVRRRAGISRVFATLPPPLALPEDWDGVTPVPLIIALHGYGGRADNFPGLWRRAAAEKSAIVVAPWGHSPVGRGSSWTDLFEAETIVDLTIAWVGERYPIDKEQIVLSGFSQGGYMAYTIGVRHPELFVGVIPMGSGYVPGLDKPPQAGIHRPRYYFMIGVDDRTVAQTRQATADFKAAGYEVDLRVYPQSGHSFPTVGRNRELTKALLFVLP